MTKDIYAPSVGESVQIGQQTNTFSISISEDLLTSLRMSRVSLYTNYIIYYLPTLSSLKTTR